MHSMLKQSIPPPTVAVPVLPPLSTLPQWTRINTLSRTCPPRPLMKDRLQRLPDTALRQKDSERTTAWDDGGSDNDDAASVESGSTSVRRIHHLEHAVLFLQQQHDKTLAALHDEVDRLKRENRGLYIIPALSLIILVTACCGNVHSEFNVSVYVYFHASANNTWRRHFVSRATLIYSAASAKWASFGFKMMSNSEMFLVVLHLSSTYC